MCAHLIQMLAGDVCSQKKAMSQWLLPLFMFSYLSCRRQQVLYFDFSFCCPGSLQGISQLSCRDRQISPTQLLTRAGLTSALMPLVSVGHLYQKIHHVLILHSALWCVEGCGEGDHGAPSPSQHCSRYRQLWECLPSALSSDPPRCVCSLSCHYPGSCVTSHPTLVPAPA